ncbi:MAG: hypothetical protein BGO14_02750 [Chlamydiales bacterium 38-26]|nr:myb/SANT-like DNA-binding domain-containing protein [Chlamydiales bacterium]OJV09270.1 MAG: hypothetical protein BGO14_02750 [Chlamydiales bacterium 38-26]
MNPIFPIPQFSVSFSMQITNDPRRLTYDNYIDLTSESQNNSITGVDSTEPTQETKNSPKVQWKYMSPQWSKEQIQVLLEAKAQFANLRGAELWENVALKVKVVRPDATPQTCRIKYNRITKDQRETNKKVMQEEETAILGLTLLKNSHIQETELLSQDQTNETTKQTLKRKIEKMSAINNSNETPLKRQKTPVTSREMWTHEDAKKLKEIVVKTNKVGKERWIEVSQNMGNKTPKQCRVKWQSIKKSLETETSSKSTTSSITLS